MQALVIDEIHNILAGTHREQRIVLNALRFLNLGPLRRRRLVLPISIRSALLAAVSIVVDQGPDAIQGLAGATIGGYRVQFDKIVSQMQTEIRIRQVVSQLLQS